MIPSKPSRIGLRGFSAAIDRLIDNRIYATPDDFLWGGTEEDVIAKGSDWCHEVPSTG